jgi:Polyketide cyclase / dehydrase and lipid transport
MPYPTAESLQIAASAQELWSLVSDLPRMGKWSPENEGGSWSNGTTGPAMGATFTGRNRNGRRTWSTTVTVVACDPGHVFEIAVTTGRMPVARWRYEFETTTDGCRVTESWLDERNRLVKVGGRVLGPHNAAHAHQQMAATLASLASAAQEAAAQN